jgi:preprotein translocase subunit SecE
MLISGMTVVLIVVAVAILGLTAALAWSTRSANPSAWIARLTEWVATSRRFLEECMAELRKVSWPTRDEARAATIAVIIGVVIVGIYLGGLDLVLSFLLTRVMS